ncbi:hypothetical protein L6452_07721 [Arctium lappa]|uniref:Uncharacterized protein n=1 Tax=Arctium lappa TaxID=4217 RepID=A0ACB9EM39_ARCLA|nr:hypothetical protein L6452_07721 [Arctium lappa]
MLRKNISKKKLLLDLNMMMKRAKIAGKSLHNLMFHHHHNWLAAFATHHRPPPPPDSNHLCFPTATPPGQYEFSCSNTNTNTPCAKNHPFSLFSFHKNHKQDSCGFNDVVLKAAMEMVYSERASPVVRQLRITDSPFPVSGGDCEEGRYVDEAAEEFISRFYSDLKLQNSKASFSSS